MTSSEVRLCALPTSLLSGILPFLRPTEVFRLFAVCSALLPRVRSSGEPVLLNALPPVIRDRIHCGNSSSSASSPPPPSSPSPPSSSPLPTDRTKSTTWSDQRSAMEVYRALRCIDITGVWRVTGTHAHGDTYEYEMTLWAIGGRHGPTELEVSIGGEVDWNGDQSMVIFGKQRGDMVLLHEMIRTKARDASLPCDTMNVCSSTISLMGDRMSGVWFQQIVKDHSQDAVVRHLFHVVSSGTFEATKIASLPHSSPHHDTAPQHTLNSSRATATSSLDERRGSSSVTIPVSDREGDHVFIFPRSPEFGFAHNG